jgi:hypothetical protein
LASKWKINEALRTSGLPSPARLIVLVLSDLADARSGVIPAERTPSLKELGEWTGLGKTPVTTHLKTLEELGWVTRTAPPLHLARREHARTTYALSIGETMERPPRPARRKKTAGDSHVPDGDMGHVPDEDMGMSSPSTCPDPEESQACTPQVHAHVPDKDMSLYSTRTVPYTNEDNDQNDEIQPPDGGGTVAPDDTEDDALFDAPSGTAKTTRKPVNGTEPTVNQRAGAITTAYVKVNPLSKKEAVFKIVKTAVGMGRWTDDQITNGLLKLAADGRVVTANSLAVALNGSRASPGGYRPYQNPVDPSSYEGDL